MADKKIDPFDVEALEKSVNDLATRVSAIWVSFLIFGLYLVIAAGTVTHRQLFLEDPVKLPVLNIELPLVGFFFLAPILFVIFHAYVLIQVLLLGRTAAAYNKAVEKAHFGTEENASIRQRLANTLFAQIFAGSPRERDGWLGWLLRAMAWITLAIAPVLILLVFEFQFLPYHSGPVTWAVRVLIVIDLAIVLVIWPAVRDPGRDVTLGRLFRQWVALSTAIVTAAFAWIVLTFPGEPHAEWTRYWPDEKARSTARQLGNDLECQTQSPVSWVAPSFDRLHLPVVNVVGNDNLEKSKEHTRAAGEPDYHGEWRRPLRSRDLNCIDLNGADLRSVDLTGSLLRGAYLLQADLQGAILNYAQLQGASFLGARLRSARLAHAGLQGASLDAAQLQGAFLDLAQLQGASFSGAELQGASLEGTQLQGALFSAADLRGASLSYAQLQGASFLAALLQGARLAHAGLQGASLEGTQLQGAFLDRAQLQGADLRGTFLSHSLISNAYVFLAEFALCDDARITGHDAHPIIAVPPDLPPWAEVGFQQL